MCRRDAGPIECQLSCRGAPNNRSMAVMEREEKKKKKKRKKTHTQTHTQNFKTLTTILAAKSKQAFYSTGPQYALSHFGPYIWNNLPHRHQALGTISPPQTTGPRNNLPTDNRPSEQSPPQTKGHRNNLPRDTRPSELSPPQTTGRRNNLPKDIRPSEQSPQRHQALGTISPQRHQSGILNNLTQRLQAH